VKNIVAGTLILLLFPVIIYGQNDCHDAIVVCGNNNYNGLNATGMGIQELTINNSCHGIENNTLWLKVPVKTGGTLGFVITPNQTNDLSVDFDFWVFGPTADCDNLGHAIRCSTTNPLAAGLLNNTTGMNGNSTDMTQGPGDDGSGFVQWLYTNDDDVYYLVIDRPIGTSNFSLEWTGTAKFHDVPTVFKADGIIPDVTQCDADGVDDNATAFDLTVHENMLKGLQTNIAFSYHLNINDVITGENPITNPEAYSNISNPQVIHLRMTNTVTGCYTNERLKIAITDPVFDGAPVNLTLCDEDDNGLRLFDLWENNLPLTTGDANVNVTYYASQEDANYQTNALSRFYTNSLPYNTETIWARLQYFTGCFGFQLAPFTLTVPPQADFNYTLDIADLAGNNNTITINMRAGNNQFEFSDDGISFTANNTFEHLVPGLYTLYIRDKNECNVINFQVPILSYPRFFSPNGDSYNEIWNIKFIRYFPDAHITIFDRFGGLIKDYYGKEKGWDGTLNGSPLPADDYWFTIEFATGRTIKSHFSLIR
jgi:gliding motility-associated-like protein